MPLAVQVCFLYVTAPDMEEARAIARHLLESSLVACANLLPNMETLYRWDGEMMEGQEVVLILKTTKTAVNAVMTRIKEMHSYDCPCITMLPVEDGDADFLNWIRRETQKGS